MTILVIAQRGAGELNSGAVANEIRAALLVGQERPTC
jgi:hypothetical protein